MNMEIEAYPDCLAELRGKNRQLNLFLGNGFSMAYDATRIPERSAISLTCG